MKSTRRCPSCASSKLLRIHQVSDQVAADRMIAMPAVRQIALAPIPGGGSRLVSIGVIEAYVCAGCGLTELYALEPDRIPIDGVHVREL